MTCAGPALPAPSARVELGIGVTCRPWTSKPVMFPAATPSPAFNTYSVSWWTATLIGVTPPDGTVASSCRPLRRMRKALIDPLAALTANSSSPDTTMDPCEPRPAPVPVPPVG